MITVEGCTPRIQELFKSRNVGASGEIRHWKTGSYEKRADGTWKKITPSKEKKDEQKTTGVREKEQDATKDKDQDDQKKQSPAKAFLAELAKRLASNLNDKQASQDLKNFLKEAKKAGVDLSIVENAFKTGLKASIDQMDFDEAEQGEIMDEVRSIFTQESNSIYDR